jgi:SecD/SecF fusion protein
MKGAGLHMKQFTNRILICLIPILLSAYIVAVAWHKYQLGEGGFKLGVDLVGGTILVYEIDASKSDLTKNLDPKDLAASLKRRIDPNDLYNVTIRPVSNTRVEIILPTGGAHQARVEQENWNNLLKAIEEHWPAVKGKNLELVPRGQTVELGRAIKNILDKESNKDQDKKDDTKDQDKKDKKDQDKAPVASEDDIAKFIDANYRSTGKKRDFTSEKIQEVKDLIAQVGSLEFRILANTQDDADAVDAAQKFFDKVNDPSTPEKEREDLKRKLEELAKDGKPPPMPEGPLEIAPGQGGYYESAKGRYRYSWVELGKAERKQLGLDNASEKLGSPNWKRAAEARKEGKAFVLPDFGYTLLYSRDCLNRKLPKEEFQQKKVEYFVLVRDPQPGKEITGQYLTAARPGVDRTMQPTVDFTFNTTGGNLFYDISSNNLPSGSEAARFYRHLAIVLDGQVMSAPRLMSAISTNGQITGKFSTKEVDNLVKILRSGALPATLNPTPVSENTIGATLGEDTIRSGSFSVMVAFVAIMAFMLVYYRFSGLVACVALLANLLLTVAFMVAVNATFTLPGLAGLVLMLGMAVDANVLIYERLREERDRGASIALAIRNGYDRAFPTIIDTHLSSIFTAIVLYVVGNDQLKGFGVSLTVGLIISLFTSLYMTRLFFDIWLARGWLHKLSMFRLLSRTNIDFMAIRYYWFTATILLTVFGITVFMVRGKEGLDIDFVGGTAYGGQLREPVPLKTLRDLLSDENQKKQLDVVKVELLDSSGKSFRITYADGSTQSVLLPNPAKGATPEEQAQDVKARAKILPDWSVEQIFLSKRSEHDPAGTSPNFTIRTSEKAPDLVQVTVDRLLRNDKGQPLQKTINLLEYQIERKKDGSTSALLTFDDYASPGYVKTLLEREFQNAGITTIQPINVVGKDKNEKNEPIKDVVSEDGEHFKLMEVTPTQAVAPTVTADNNKVFKAILEQTKKDFGARPQPERLENFDSQLAADTQTRAMYAILASWGAILLFLWFRFGNWTFGLATVVCLIHDLFFTMGVIAFSHYIHAWAPGLATALGLQDFKINLPAVAALLTLVGYSVNDTIVVFDRIREVRGKNPELTPQMINDSVNQTLSRTLLTAFSVFLVVIVLYIWGGEGLHLFAFVMVVGVIVGTYSSIYIASPLLLIFGEGKHPSRVSGPKPQPEPEPEPEAETEETPA